MDLKLFGCGFVSLSCFSFLVFDYLTYNPTPHETTALKQSSLLVRANESNVKLQTKAVDATTALPVAAPANALNEKSEDNTQTIAQQNAAHDKARKRIQSKTYESASITGFLEPQGFSRPNWRPQTENGIPIGLFETQRFVVLLDPGHGGIDPGAISHNGLQEKQLTLDIAKRTRLYLSNHPNIDVVFTRDTDEGLSRDERLQKITDSDADLLISLHFNNLPQTDLALVETYFAGQRNIQESLDKQRENNGASDHGYVKTLNTSNHFPFTRSSQHLANILQQHVYNEVSAYNSNAENAGVKKDTLFVLTRSFTTSALIELTCLSNPAEAQKLETVEYRNRLSSALADAILEYRRSTIYTRMFGPDKPKRSPSLVRFSPAIEHPNKGPKSSV